MFGALEMDSNFGSLFVMENKFYAKQWGQIELGVRTLLLTSLKYCPPLDKTIF